MLWLETHVRSQRLCHEAGQRADGAGATLPVFLFWAVQLGL